MSEMFEPQATRELTSHVGRRVLTGAVRPIKEPSTHAGRDWKRCFLAPGNWQDHPMERHVQGQTILLHTVFDIAVAGVESIEIVS